jgi:pimeloyl-ACP methyl ester carboxylesterase
MLFLYCAAILLAVVLLICLYCFRTCFYSPSNRTEDPYQALDGEQYAALNEGIIYCTGRMEQSPCEFITVKSFDSTTLSGRYYHHNDGAPVLLLFHGYRSMALRDCAGGYILGKKLGFNVLAVDQRAHGRSGGHVISFGIRERKDCLCWINYLNNRFGSKTPILLSGLSMGAATVLMAADLPLTANVCAILADCPYSDPCDIILKVAADRRLPTKLVRPFILLSARIFGGFSLMESSAVKAVQNASVPILLIHGEDDRFVPCEMSYIIAKKCKSTCTLHTFPDAGHGLCYTMNPDRYEAITIRFLTSLPALEPFLSKNTYAKQQMKGNL